MKKIQKGSRVGTIWGYGFITDIIESCWATTYKFKLDGGAEMTLHREDFTSVY